MLEIRSLERQLSEVSEFNLFLAEQKRDIKFLAYIHE